MTIMIRRFIIGAAAVVLTTSMASAQTTPNELIESTAAQLLDVLDADREALQADRVRLYALVDESLLPNFDTRYAAQRVLARHWRTASKEQRERFIAAFYTALRKAYANGLLEFTAERMTVLPFRGDPSANKAKVRTEVRLDDGKRVPVDYSLRFRDEDGWKVWDVTIEGISFVKSYRTDFGSEIGARGLDAVIERLENEGVRIGAATDGE